MGPGIIKPRNQSKAAAKLTFKKRKDCVMKKTRELSILCDVKACALIIDQDGKIETWPDNQSEVEEILNFKKDKVFKKNNGKIQETKKITASNHGDESNEDLVKIIDEKLEYLNSRIELIKKFRNYGEDGNFAIECLLSPSVAATEGGGGSWVPSPCPHPVQAITTNILDDFEEFWKDQELKTGETNSGVGADCMESEAIPSFEHEDFQLDNILGQESDEQNFWASLLQTMDGVADHSLMDFDFQQECFC